MTGKRVAATVIDTVPLARNLLRGRVERTSLASLAQFFGVSVQPCHRALPDAQATAEVFLRLVDLALERGASTLAELEELAAPRPRRIHGKRHLVHGAPAEPGVYLFLDAQRRVLYVGKARDLRARLRSYFSGERQRPSVEAALGVLVRVDWRPCGSELEAALDELALLRELRPPANARGTRPDRHLYLRRRGARWVCGPEPTPHGPVSGRGLARRAAQALDGFEGDDPRAALPALRLRLARLARDLRYEDAARLRDRIAALEQAVERIDEVRRLRSLRACLVVPAVEPRMVRAIFVAGAVVARRTVPFGGGGRIEVEAGLRDARVAPAAALAGVVVDELLLLATFLRRPPPELRVSALDRDSILAAVNGVALAA
jgi:DNA polymerase III subunit epsilon